MIKTIEPDMVDNIINILDEQDITNAVEQASAVLACGGLIVAPTETRYGIITRADDQSLLEKMCRVKERSSSKPVAMLLRSTSDIHNFAESNTLSKSLADEFFPGPLTLVLKSNHSWLPPRIVGGKIGLRISSERFINALLEKCGFPVCATSANKSDRNELDSVKEIVDEFGSSIDLYINRGSLCGCTSTVVDCSSGEPAILRVGAISKERLESVWERPD